MTNTVSLQRKLSSACLRDYLELCKPRVVLLMILTSLVGMCLASPAWVSWQILIFGNLGIALAAAAAAAINHLADYRIDKIMARTQQRPIVKGRVSVLETVIFAIVLCGLSMWMLVWFVNPLTAELTFLSVIGYAGVYTFYLKHATSQNIVIGGLAGAAPPMLGWVAVTGHVDLPALILLLIIFVWTPPHFWALAIDRVDDYAKANVPMLPITHGIKHTKKCIVAYTVLLYLVSLVPFLIHSSHIIYLCGASTLGAWFLWGTIKLYRDPKHRCSMKVFRDSIIYLMLLFIFLLVDHYWVIH